MKRIGVDIGADEVASISGSNRKNTSNRRQPLAHFYDRASIELVRKREEWLIDQFGYSEPGG